jgi:hypothetical protein
MSLPEKKIDSFALVILMPQMKKFQLYWSKDRCTNTKADNKQGNIHDHYILIFFIMK